MPSRSKHRPGSPLQKKARRGFQGYPVATIAFYGPDDTRASKVAVCIMTGEDQPPAAMERWFSGVADLRHDPVVGEQILAFIQRHQAKSVVVADRILGCPHEEGIDYPEGEVCPQCPFWARRDRWTGEVLS
ncbi:MAG TPA: hypothetical protein VFB14_26860 [Bryobacteraceae bacterium]|nr:hypothetical protein [Bryobacteraceae bacterium]